MKRKTTFSIDNGSSKTSARQRISLLIMMAHQRMPSIQNVEKKDYINSIEASRQVSYAVGYANTCPYYCKVCECSRNNYKSLA